MNGTNERSQPFIGQSRDSERRPANTAYNPPHSICTVYLDNILLLLLYIAVEKAKEEWRPSVAVGVKPR